MKKIHYILAVQSVTGALLCCNASGEFYTAAVVSGMAYSGDYDKSNSQYASGFSSGDFSSGFSVWNSSGNAKTMFGINSLCAETEYAYAVGYGNPAYSDNPGASASFNLNWSAENGSQSGTIVSAELGLGNSVNGQYIGSLSFVYGTAYTVQSVLNVTASYSNSTTQAQSLWDDTFTFVGEPNGTLGTATFTVSLDGSIGEQTSQYKGPSAAGLVTFDQIALIANFNGGASVSSIALPQGTSIEAASGTIYPTPEPSTFSLVGLGFGSLCLVWSKRKFWPAAKA